MKNPLKGGRGKDTMGHPEQNTLEAINKLKDEYPYAAAFLVYVIIERELKDYLMSHRKDEQFKCRKIKDKCLNDYATMNDKDFLNNVICKATLGSVEQALDLAQESRPSADRNKLVHSNLYILDEKSLSDGKRQNKNKEHFNKAVEHLKYIFNTFCFNTFCEKYSTIEKAGELAFEEKPEK